MKKYGWKGFHMKDGKLFCRDKEYKVHEIETQDGELKPCKNGLHFCWNLQDVHGFYNFRDKDMALGKVEILGDVVDDNDKNKSVTNKLKIVKLYKTKMEIAECANEGKENAGYFNTGDWNTGNCNTGDWNTGNCNTGNRNIGDCNTGDCNTGNCNTGNRNIGDCNTGDWNSCDWSNGLFNTQSPKINLFNKPSDYTMDEFRQTKWFYALTNSCFTLTEWVYYTDEEKAQDKTKEAIGGYLKSYTYKEACANWWNSLSDDNRETIKTIPNFDKNIFTKITGIEV